VQVGNVARLASTPRRWMVKRFLKVHEFLAFQGFILTLAIHGEALEIYGQMPKGVLGGGKPSQ